MDGRGDDPGVSIIALTRRRSNRGIEGYGRGAWILYRGIKRTLQLIHTNSLFCGEPFSLVSGMAPNAPLYEQGDEHCCWGWGSQDHISILLHSTQEWFLFSICPMGEGGVAASPLPIPLHPHARLFSAMS